MADGPKPAPRRKPTAPKRKGEGDLYRAIFDCVSDAILVVEPETGALRQVNQRMGELFGYTVEEAIAQDLGGLSVGLRPCAFEDMQGWMRKAMDQGPQTFEWLARTKRGRLFWVEMNLRRALLGGEDLLLLVARDIADRKRLESEHQARLGRAEAQNAVSLALAGAGPDTQAALTLIATHLAKQVGDLCLVSLVGHDGELRVAAMHQPYLDGDPYLPDRDALAPIPLGQFGEGRVAQTGDALLVTDPTWNEILPLVPEAFHAYFRRFSVHSLLIVGMRQEDHTVGTILLAKGGSSRAYTPVDQSMLQNLADRAALTLSHAKLFAENLHQAEELRRANAELEHRVAARTAELAEANAKLQELAIKDGLTGLANRRYFDAVLEEELRRARRTPGATLGLILCDVDFFKRYNDAYGHLQGDACLQGVGSVMQEVFKRAGEIPARYGGEEFAVILPSVKEADALTVAEKLRATMEGRQIPHVKSDAAPVVTLSIGVVVLVVGLDTGPEDLITRADAALYRCKAQGRNRVCLGE